MSSETENKVIRSPRPLDMSALSREELLRVFKNVVYIDRQVPKLWEQFNQGLKEYKNNKIQEAFNNELAKTEHQEMIEKLSQRKYKNPGKSPVDLSDLIVKIFNLVKHFLIILVCGYLYIMIYGLIVLLGLNSLIGLYPYPSHTLGNLIILLIEYLIGLGFGILVLVSYVSACYDEYRKEKVRERVRSYENDVYQEVVQAHSKQFEQEYYQLNHDVLIEINDYLDFPDYVDWEITSLDNDLKTPYALQFYISRLENFEANDFSNLVFLFRQSLQHEEIRNLQIRQIREQREASERLLRKVEAQHKESLAQNELHSQKESEEHRHIQWELERIYNKLS